MLYAYESVVHFAPFGPQPASTICYTSLLVMFGADYLIPVR